MTTSSSLSIILLFFFLNLFVILYVTIDFLLSTMIVSFIMSFYYCIYLFLQDGQSVRQHSCKHTPFTCVSYSLQHYISQWLLSPYLLRIFLYTISHKQRVQIAYHYQRTLLNLIRTLLYKVLMIHYVKTYEYICSYKSYS